MSKILSLLIISLALQSDDIRVEKPTMHNFYKKIKTNAKIVELTNQKNSLHSLISGKIDRYFVKEGQSLKRGDPIVEISSIELSQISLEFLSAKSQYKTLKSNFLSSKKLFSKGLISKKELSDESIKKDNLQAKFQNLQAKLVALNIDTKTLRKPISKVVLHAKNSSTISKILKPINSMITRDTKLIELSNRGSLFLSSYLPTKYAHLIKDIEKISFKDANKTILSFVNQVLPKIDKETKQIVIYSSIKESRSLFIDSFVKATIYVKPKRDYLAIKKSALSFYDNDWVVFVPKKEDEHHEEHEDEKEDEDEHHEEVIFEARVIKVLDEDDEFVAIDGLNKDESYVSEKPYIVKSMLLKSAMGGHGH